MFIFKMEFHQRTLINFKTYFYNNKFQLTLSLKIQLSLDVNSD